MSTEKLKLFKKKVKQSENDGNDLRLKNIIYLYPQWAPWSLEGLWKSNYYLFHLILIDVQFMSYFLEWKVAGTW